MKNTDISDEQKPDGYEDLFDDEQKPDGYDDFLDDEREDNTNTKGKILFQKPKPNTKIYEPRDPLAMPDLLKMKKKMNPVKDGWDRNHFDAFAPTKEDLKRISEEELPRFEYLDSNTKSKISKKK